ncbi:MAG TPA: hypothetical protein VL947_13400 [Cytophagales bacterium]|nr:hypothetical protein [Cytophagales bacterium]
MKASHLIKLATVRLDTYPVKIKHVFSTQIFKHGAEWMYIYMQGKAPHATFDPSTPYHTYGLYKYGISITACLASLFALIQIHILLAPLSILVFYCFEIQFLFLFPLLLDKVSKPIVKSILYTYKVGPFKALFIVLQIGTFMVLGLLNFRNPLRKWYIGCISVLIWYELEVRPHLFEAPPKHS